MLNLEKVEIDNFLNSLEYSLSRRVQAVTITVLHGLPQPTLTIEQAIEYIQNYSGTQNSSIPILQYEIDIRYNTGDIIHAIFQHKAEAINFLRTFS